MHRLKSKKRTNKQKRTLKRRGGTRLWVGSFEKDRNDRIAKSELDKNFTEGTLTNLGKALERRPYLNICTLKNVSSMPNTDKNYKQIGYLFAKYKFPYDFVSLEWAIDHYLETNIIPLLKEKNIYQTNVKNNIKIHNFDIQELRDSQQEECYLLKGDVYVYNLDKLNAGINNTVFNKLPDDIGNQIKDYMGVKHEYSSKV